jgi:hypothetical protein
VQKRAKREQTGTLREREGGKREGAREGRKEGALCPVGEGVRARAEREGGRAAGDGGRKREGERGRERKREMT